MHGRSTHQRRGLTPARAFAVLSGVVLSATIGISADAGTTTKPYTATWLDASSTPIANPPNTLSVAAGSDTIVLRITNNANPQSLGSANITAPAGYTLQAGSSVSTGSVATSGSTLQLRNLNLAPSASVDVTINVNAGCGSEGTKSWTLAVKQANDFSGPPGNSFVLASGTAVPSSTVTGATCMLRFANQPNTTQTGNVIKDGYNSTGNAIKVEIYDPLTGNTVDSSASVTLTASFNPAGGSLSGGGPVAAAHGVATFSNLRLDTAGAYQLQATSPIATNQPVSNRFMVADLVTTCSDPSCAFPISKNKNTYTTDPVTGTTGATYVAALNLAGLTISCDFSPYNYPDSQQPNAVWFGYDDGNLSQKIVTIVIDKQTVQATPNNGTSFYHVCYSSPTPFTDINGNAAPADPWPNGPSSYFGTTWYTGLLPSCSAVNNVAPCDLGWTATSGGGRSGSFLAPIGDPTYR